MEGKFYSVSVEESVFAFAIFALVEEGVLVAEILLEMWAKKMTHGSVVEAED